MSIKKVKKSEKNEQNLKEKTAHAIVWSFVDKFGQQALSIAIGIILARYFLSPSEYGLIALIFIFHALGWALIDSGFSNALIRKQDVTQTDLSSVFYFNISLGVLVYFVLFFCAPAIASFYDKPILTHLIRVMLLNIPLCSLLLIQTTIFSKSVNFKPLARTNLIALFCSGFLTIFLAWKGLGVWVLVIQPLTGTSIKIICLWSISSWKPAMVYSKQSIKNLWKYSSNLLASSVLNIVFQNIYAMLIGKIQPLEIVGYYNQAYKYSDIPFATVIPAIQTAVFPAMAKIGDDEERLKHAFRKTVRVSSFVYFPVMLGLIAIAEPMIQTLLGVKWLPVVFYMKWFCLGYIFLGMASIYANILFIKGLSATLLRFNIFYRLLQLLGIVFTIRFGIIALVISWVIASVLYAFLMIFYAGKKIHYSLPEQVNDIFPYLTLALLMCAGVFSLSYLINNYVILLLTQLTAGMLLYLGLSYLLGSKVFHEVVGIVQNKMNNTIFAPLIR